MYHSNLDLFTFDCLLNLNSTFICLHVMSVLFSVYYYFLSISYHLYSHIGSFRIGISLKSLTEYAKMHAHAYTMYVVLCV
ncbi:hypothetical protein AMELA_G00070330 [Ameiurus melas]|uniref:Uncharacterized protein n=1 Tax=Ameiurus melas TaxID=219545 RepID=A0A7J6B3W9_AMEME|nr:hypothetical protein AMELA_G00070330 [Ameiurus melas]